jgi:hypothetical protein
MTTGFLVITSSKIKQAQLGSRKRDFIENLESEGSLMSS